MLVHIFTWYSQCHLNQAKDCVGNSLLWGWLQYWFFIKILSNKKKFCLTIKTCSWKHYEISLAWKYLFRQTLMHTLENNSVIILNQTIDSRVKKFIKLLESSTNYQKFLILHALGYWLLLYNRKEKKMQLKQCLVCATILSGLSSISLHFYRFWKPVESWYPQDQLFFKA